MASISINRREAMSLALSAATAATLAGVGQARADAAASGSAPPELDRFIRGYLPAMNAPGLSLALTSAQRTLHTAAYGYADLAAKTPVNTSHLFEIGSITKSFVGIVILQLHQEGKLDLHQPILHYLPWLAMQTEYGEVTVHHLLTHTSGMPGNDPVFPAAPGMRARQGFKPGSKFHYCNWAYDVLGFLIEKIDGRSWAAALTQRVLAPLGMKDTQPMVPSSARTRLVTSYVPLLEDRPYPRHGAVIQAGNLTVTSTAGCIASTPADMARYMQMLLNRGAAPSSRILSEESFKLFSTSHTSAPDFGPGAGYGYGIAVDQFEGHTRLRHTGGMVSFMSAMQIDLDAGFGAYASINAQLGYRPNPVAQFALQLLRARQERKPLPPAPAPDEAIVVEHPEQYAGVYSAPNGRRLEVRAAKDRLALHVDGKEIRLQQSAADEFIADHPAFALHPLFFGRAPQSEESTSETAAPVIELSYGSDWYAHSRHPGSAAPAAAPGSEAYAGLYYSENPWNGSVRVVLRRGQLWVNGTTALVPCGDRLFRVGTDPTSPETIEFIHVADGRAQVLYYGGGQYKRMPDEAA